MCPLKPRSPVRAFQVIVALYLVALPLSAPLSRLLLDHSDPGLMRIAIFGLWVFTMFEFLTALFRID